jgi:hypothetical protein
VKGDEAIDRAADRLDAAAQKAATSGGLRARLGDELADDAAFLRKLKPSLMVARAKGEAPTNEKPGEVRAAPAGPQLGKRPTPSGAGTRSPWLVVAGALAAGVALAKTIDWRGHAHPRE